MCRQTELQILMVVFEHSSFCFKQIVPPQTHAIGWASVAGKVVGLQCLNKGVKLLTYTITNYFIFKKNLEEINDFIQQGCIKLIKSDSKDIYNVTKDCYFK